MNQEQEMLNVALASLPLAAARKVVVHSSMLGLGIAREDLPYVRRMISRQLGATGTLAVPTYTQANRLTPFNREKSPSVGVGALSEHVRSLKGSIRSRNVINSHAAIGPDASVMSSGNPLDPLGPESDFSYLCAEGFYLLLLGTDFSKGCTFLHHLEQIANVPYRHMITLERMVASEELTQPVTVQYFARKNAQLKTDFNRIIPQLRNMPSYAERTIGANFPIHFVGLQDLRKVGIDLLEKDPLFFVGPQSREM